MLKHARNYARIYKQYNFPYVAQPGSDMYKAIEWFKQNLPGWEKKARRYREREKRRQRRLEQRRTGAKPNSAKEVCGGVSLIF